MADLSGQDIVASIVNGDQDVNLVDIGDAIESRLDAGHVRTRWWVHFDDRYLSADSMNVLACKYFERNMNIPWEDANPAKLAHRVALVQAQLVEGDELSWEQALAKLRSLNDSDITFGEVAEVNPPKDDSPSGD